MKIATTLLLFFVFSVIQAQPSSEIIKTANELIEKKKYQSAYLALETFDPNNNNAEIVLLKEQILLQYFVTSIMHQVFALKDLEANEDVMDYRGKEGHYDMYMFNADSILNNLIRKDPANCKLYKGLGEFYYEVHLKYGGNWIKNDQEIFDAIETNFTKANQLQCSDYITYYVLGYLDLIHEKYGESIPKFLRSLELNKDYASAHYNLAYAYLFTDDRANALTYAKNSLSLYTDVVYKGDAARMVGQIYTELNDDQNALLHYEMAQEIDPNNYYTLRSLLNLYLKINHPKTMETSQTFFNLAPDNPTIYNDLGQLYFNNSKENDLLAFYQKQISSFSGDAKVLGNLNFYMANIYIDTDKEKTKFHFKAAKEYFLQFLPKDHEVFQLIEEGLEKVK